MTGKTCIIFCPSRRLFSTSKKRRERIESLLTAYGIEYDLIESERKQSVSRLVLMLVKNNYDNIIIAGGDAALSDAVNSLMRLEKQTRLRIALGVIPNGTMNDFAGYWGFRYDDPEYCIASLLEHRTRRIDVGAVRYTNSRGEEEIHYFINSVAIGLLAQIQRLRQQAKHTFFGSKEMAFLPSLLMMIFHKLSYRVQYTMHHETESRRINTLSIGNGKGYGLTPNAVPYSGTLDVTAVEESVWTQFASAAYLFLRGRILNHKTALPYRTREISISSSTSRLPLSIDGRPAPTPDSPVQISVAAEEINFIIEK